MAEFQEVMKQAKRMCLVHACSNCPVRSMEGDCRIDFCNIDKLRDQKEVETVESIVMDWAEKHPEPRYPSWEEWWKNTFPNATEAFPPCKGYFIDLGDRRKQCRIPCEVCKKQPITADIAENLGIKPIGGDERCLN